MITLFGIPVPLVFVLVPLVLVSAIAVGVTYAAHRLTDLSGLGLVLTSIAVTEAIVTAILLVMLFASSRNLTNPEDRNGFAFAAFFAALALAVSFAASIPTVLLTLRIIHRS